MTGAGTFDTGGAVRGGGAWTHIRENGEVKARGHWKPTEFISFDVFEGPIPGFQGGVLVIAVDLTRIEDGEVFSAELTITCLVNAPEIFDGDEGIMIIFDDFPLVFIESTGGFTLFNLIKDDN